MMKEAATLSIRNTEPDDAALVIVRYDATRIALCLSLESDGDVELVMEKSDARRVVEALQRALAAS